MKYTFEKKFEAHLGLTGDKRCIIPDQVNDDQAEYDGKTFPALLLEGRSVSKKIRVKLIGDDYDLFGVGTGDTVVRRA